MHPQREGPRYSQSSATRRANHDCGDLRLQPEKPLRASHNGCLQDAADLTRAWSSTLDHETRSGAAACTKSVGSGRHKLQRHSHPDAAHAESELQHGTGVSMPQGPVTLPWCGSNTEHQGPRRRRSRSEAFRMSHLPLLKVGGRPGDAAHDVHASSMAFCISEKTRSCTSSYLSHTCPPARL